MAIGFEVGDKISLHVAEQTSVVLRRCVLAITYLQRIAIAYRNAVEWRGAPDHLAVEFL